MAHCFAAIGVALLALTLGLASAQETTATDLQPCTMLPGCSACEQRVPPSTTAQSSGRRLHADDAGVQLTKDQLPEALRPFAGMYGGFAMHGPRSYQARPNPGSFRGGFNGSRKGFSSGQGGNLTRLDGNNKAAFNGTWPSPGTFNGSRPELHVGYNKSSINGSWPHPNLNVSRGKSTRGTSRGGAGQPRGLQPYPHRISVPATSQQLPANSRSSQVVWSSQAGTADGRTSAATTPPAATAGSFSGAPVGAAAGAQGAMPTGQQQVQAAAAAAAQQILQRSRRSSFSSKGIEQQQGRQWGANMDSLLLEQLKSRHGSQGSSMEGPAPPLWSNKMGPGGFKEMPYSGPSGPAAVGPSGLAVAGMREDMGHQWSIPQGTSVVGGGPNGPAALLDGEITSGSGLGAPQPQGQAPFNSSSSSSPDSAAAAGGAAPNGAPGPRDEAAGGAGMMLARNQFVGDARGRRQANSMTLFPSSFDLACTACVGPAYVLSASGGFCECGEGYGLIPPSALTAQATPSCQRCPEGQVPFTATSGLELFFNSSTNRVELQLTTADGSQEATSGSSSSSTANPRSKGLPFCMACPAGSAPNYSGTKCVASS